MQAALPTPVSTGSGSKGFSQCPARGASISPRAFSSWKGIPLAAVWDYTCRSHDNASMRNVLLFSCLLAGVVVGGAHAQAPCAGATETGRPATPAPAAPPAKTPRPPRPRHPRRRDIRAMAITVTASAWRSTIPGRARGLRVAIDRAAAIRTPAVRSFPRTIGWNVSTRFGGGTGLRSKKSSCAGRCSTWTSRSAGAGTQGRLPAPAATAGLGTGLVRRVKCFPSSSATAGKVRRRQPRRESLLSCSGSSGRR